MYKIVKKINDYKVIINAGASAGLKEGQLFLIYTESERIIDPDSGNDLGAAEIVKGKAKITHLQDKLSTLEPIPTTKAGKKTIIKKKNPNPFFSGFGNGESETITEEDPSIVILPFTDVDVGDLVKPI